MNFGWVTSEEDSFQIMDRALELGINFFDTADVYGWTVEHGPTEEIIGRWFAQGGGRRDAVILATKVYNPVTRKANRREPNADGRSLSAIKIKKHCEGSLRRLQTDWIDLYQMHHVDRSCPWDETWQGFNSLVQQGKIVYAGSSNFAGWDIATACQEASRRGMTGLVSEQSTYSLNNRMIELEVIPACRHYGLGLIPWSPLAGGLLGGALGKAQAGRRMDRRFRQASGDEPRQARASTRRSAGNSARSRAPSRWPGCCTIRWSPRRSSARAPWNSWKPQCTPRKSHLSVDVLKRLDEIFPGPGGEAPDAYAW